MMTNCGNLLRWISLGKYETKLYYGAKQYYYSTITGGILSLLFALAVIGTSFIILDKTINWKNYSITNSYTDL